MDIGTSWKTAEFHDLPNNQGHSKHQKCIFHDDFESNFYSWKVNYSK